MIASCLLAGGIERRWGFLLLLSCLVFVAGQPLHGAPPAPARTDLHGDPLPPGAVARFGSTRLRHGAWVYCAAFSPDGRTLASGGEDQAVRLWQAATGQELWSYCGQERNVDSVAFSPDGHWIASGNADGTIHVLDAATGEAVIRLPGDTGRLTALAFSPDGKLLASGTGYVEECTVRLWDVAAARELRQLKDARGTEFLLAFAPDGRTLASCNATHLLLWDVATGEVLRDRTLARHTWGLAFCPDGKTLATVNADGWVYLWEAATGKEVRRLPGSGQVAFSPDGKQLICGGEHTLRQWDTASGELVRVLDSDINSPRFIACSPDGRTVASAGSNNGIRLWDAATGKPICRFAGHEDRITDLAFSPDGRRLVTGDRDRTLCVWHARTGAELNQFAEGGSDGPPLAISPDGKTLACGGVDRAIRLRDLATGEALGELSNAGAEGTGVYPFDCLAFAPDGKVLASGNSAGTRLWDLATRRELRRLEVSGHSHTLLFSADGKLLIALEHGPNTVEWRIHLRDPGTNQTLRQIGPGEPYRFNYSVPIVNCLALAPDARYLAGGGRKDLGSGAMVLFWETATWKQCFALETPAEAIHAVAFSPDGKLLASGDDEGVVSLWELSTGRERRRFHGHRGSVRALAFSPDGTALASGSTDSTALLWSLVEPIRGNHSPVYPLSRQERERLWTDLASAEASCADQAIRELIATPADAVSLLRDRLRPVPQTFGQRVGQLIRQLDSDEFGERQKAVEELQSLRDMAEPILRKAVAMQPAPEVRRRLGQLLEGWDGRVSSTELLRALRAVEVLEHLDTAEARQLLKALAAGFAEARVTREASMALARLEKRAASWPSTEY